MVNNLIMGIDTKIIQVCQWPKNMWAHHIQCAIYATSQVAMISAYHILNGAYFY